MLSRIAAFVALGEGGGERGDISPLIQFCGAFACRRSLGKPGIAPAGMRGKLMPANSEGQMSETRNSLDGNHLRAFIDRIEKLEDEKRAISDDIKDVYSEANGTGFNAKIIRKIVSARRKQKAARDEENALLSLYAEAIDQPDLFGGSN